MTQLVLDFYHSISHIVKGNASETEVLRSISNLLRARSGEENYFLIPHMRFSEANDKEVIDLLLLHPVFGLFLIDIESDCCPEALDGIEAALARLHDQREALANHVRESLGKLPITIEGRLIFPGLSRQHGEVFFEQRPDLASRRGRVLFGEDFKEESRFQTFFMGSAPRIPNTLEFMAVTELLLSKDRARLAEGRILPVITRDEVIFFDYRQLSILSGYEGGFRIIRGVAGTGKTVIMTHFIGNRLRQFSDERFLVLVYNARLKDSIENSLQEDDRDTGRVKVQTLLKFLVDLRFDWVAAGVSEGQAAPLGTKMDGLKTRTATVEFQHCLREWLNGNPVDFFLCDETQDMPPNLMRVLYEEIGNCLFFIDEAQRFSEHAMNSIAEVFHHPDFARINMSGRVKNLKNVYRTPSNIARCAFDILSDDTALNDYYRKSRYLQRGFLADIHFVLQDGLIRLGRWDWDDTLHKLLGQVTPMPTRILTPFVKDRDRLQGLIHDWGLHDWVSVDTYEGIKGLEAERVILHNFEGFIATTLKHRRDLLLRKTYVILTRALRELYVSTGRLADSPEPMVQRLMEKLRHYGESGALPAPDPADTLTPTPTAPGSHSGNRQKPLQQGFLTESGHTAVDPTREEPAPQRGATTEMPTQVTANTPGQVPSAPSRLSLGRLMESLRNSRDVGEFIVTGASVWSLVSGLFG